MDWLDKYKCYSNIKEVGDYIDDVQKLRYLFQSMQYNVSKRDCFQMKIKQ